MDIQQRLEKSGIVIPEILLPRNAELRQWAVIACDQFTQDRSYWQKAGEASGNSPSALHLIFPEAFLEDGPGRNPAPRFDRTEVPLRIDDIHQFMRNYLDAGVFAAWRGFVYLERDTPFNRGRRGLVAAVDLEQYDWSPDSRPLIRATEGTVAERLPPRMNIRRNAPLETTHVILLIDDDTDTLLPGLAERAKTIPPVYQGELMLNSGNISGWFLDTEGDWDFLATGLEELTRKAVTRYDGLSNPRSPVPCPRSPFLFAVGDGNHSLACAKGIWEEYKAARGRGTLPVHPCRYALVEIENIYDPAIRFEPIHRIVFGPGFDETLKLLSGLPGFHCRDVAGRGEMTRAVAEPVKGNRFGIVSGDRYALAETSAGGIATASLQPLLDKAVNGSGGAFSIDYIHGEDELIRLAGTPGKPVTGILLPPVRKAGLFETVARSGPLPRKSFSMGEAEEKRFYIESRKLFG